MSGDYLRAVIRPARQDLCGVHKDSTRPIVL